MAAAEFAGTVVGAFGVGVGCETGTEDAAGEGDGEATDGAKPPTRGADGTEAEGVFPERMS